MLETTGVEYRSGPFRAFVMLVHKSPYYMRLDWYFS